MAGPLQEMQNQPMPQPAPPQFAGNSLTDQLMQSMLQRAVQFPQQLQEQQARENQALTDYQNALRTAGKDTQGPIDAFATGMLTSPNPADVMATHARGFSNMEAARQHRLQQEGAGEIGATKAGLDSAQKQTRELIDEMRFNPGLRGKVGGAGGGVITRQQKDGTIVVLDKTTGAELRRYDPNESDQFKQFKTKFLEIGDRSGKFETLEDLDAWASEQAMQSIGQSRKAVGNINPAPGSPNRIDESTADGTQFKLDVSGWTPERRAEVKRLIDSYRLAPSEGTRKRLEQAMMEAEGQSTPVPSAAPPAPKNEIRQPRERKSDEGYGTEEGKNLANEYQSLRDGYSAAASLRGELSLLRKLYQQDLPEGAFAEAFQTAKSGMTSLGIDVGPEVGQAAVASALAKKLALQIRTQGEKNLLPGAMSNYEDQLLQSMAPTLAQTAAGRKALVELMDIIAQSNMKVAEAATSFASKNKDRLTPAWNQVKEFTIKREMVRLARARKEILQQMGVKE
jgi:hypothetical protein